MAGRARALFVSTPSLRAKLQPHNPDTEVVENFISDRPWRKPPAERAEDGALRALYFGTKTHDADLQFLLPALEKVSRRYPRFRLRIIGILGAHLSLPPWIEEVPLTDENKKYPDFVSLLQQQARDVDFGI